MTANGLMFMRKVGTVATALVASGAIISWISGFAWTLATRPIVESIAEERTARVHSDSLLTERLSTISHDRIELLDIMSTPPGPKRDAKMALVRELWARNR